jgi:hypothetical protein
MSKLIDLKKIVGKRVFESEMPKEKKTAILKFVKEANEEALTQFLSQIKTQKFFVKEGVITKQEALKIVKKN